MKGETHLATLLSAMTPRVNEGDFVFCSMHENLQIDPGEIAGSIREKEGLTIIVKKETADKLHLEYSTVTTWITLTVHSSLDAVGFTAAFSKALAEKGISCNVVAGFYHDHIFVPKTEADKALETLRRLSVNF